MVPLIFWRVFALRRYWRLMATTESTNNPPEEPSAEHPAFSFDDRPVKILWACDMTTQQGEESWLCLAESATGGRAALDVTVSSWGSISVLGRYRIDELGRREVYLERSWDAPANYRPQACEVLTRLADELVFAPQVILQWALLDLNPEYLAKAIAAGADLRGEPIDGMLPIDYAAAAASFSAAQVQRFFRDDEREHRWEENFEAGCDGGFAGRAVEIRRMLKAAGATDAAGFRRALREGDFDHARAEMLAGVPVDSLSPTGLSPLCEALLAKDLRRVKWLLRHGANRHEPSEMRSRLLPPLAPELASRLFSDFKLPPLVAACVAGFPAGFVALTREDGDRPVADDYANLLETCVPPDWALREIARAGFDLRSLKDPPFDKWRGYPGTGTCDSVRELARIAGREVLDSWAPAALAWLCGEEETPATLEFVRTLLELGVSPGGDRAGGRDWIQDLVEAGEITPEALREMQEGARNSRALLSGESPLHIAACKGNAGMEALLLEFGADPEARDNLGRKPEDLRRTEHRGDACAAFLRGLEGEGNPRDWARENAPDLLARTADDQDALLELLARWMGEAGGDPRPHKLLLKAVEQNSPELVELLLRADRDPKEMGFSLVAAMQRADLLCEQAKDFFVSRGPIGDPGPPPEFYATAAAICALLKNAGAPDFTRLPAAARAGDVDGIRRELAAGTPANFQLDGWGTPLLAAIAGKQPASVHALFEAGADPDFAFRVGLNNPDIDEIYPVKAALESGDDAILRAVLEAGADLEKGDVARAGLFRCKIAGPKVAALVFGGRDVFVRWRDSMGNTGAHLLDAENFRVCEHLIPREALDARNYRAETPVLFALSHGALGKAFALLEAGADPSRYGGLSGDLKFSDGAYGAMPGDLGIICLNPMHTAILSGNVLFLERMLAAGGRFDLPAFAVKGEPPALERFRGELRDFWPTVMPPMEGGLSALGNGISMMFDIPNTAGVPGLEWHEALFLQHFLSENPSRAAAWREFVVPMSCLDLAAATGSAVMRETVMSGRALEGRAFFEALRGDIASLAADFRQALATPDADKPRTYGCICAIRRIESAMIMKIWEKTGEVPPQADKDSAMDCLRFAGAEFDGKFLGAVEKLEATGGLSMDEFVGGLAEGFRPGSTVDLGKFFTTALATLERFDRTCAAQW